ncbi:hypothetical protein ANN_17720, partial [Periplaneta americana]
FSTSRHTLMWVPDSFFTALLSGRISSLRDEMGAIFIDRDPKLFATILNYLRTRDIDLNVDIRAFRHEAEYYGITPLVKRLMLCEDLSQSSCGDVLFYGYLPPPCMYIIKTNHIVGKAPMRGAGINISSMTTRRRIKELGFSCRTPTKKLFLKPYIVKKRLSWAKQHQSWTVDEWKKVCFSDESIIQILADKSVFVRRRKGEKYNNDCIMKTVKHPLSLMVWSVISGHGRLYFVQGMMRQYQYIKILKERLLPHIREWFPDGYFVAIDTNVFPVNRSQAIREIPYIEVLFRNLPEGIPVQDPGVTCSSPPGENSAAVHAAARPGSIVRVPVDPSPASTSVNNGNTAVSTTAPSLPTLPSAIISCVPPPVPPLAPLSVPATPVVTPPCLAPAATTAVTINPVLSTSHNNGILLGGAHVLGSHPQPPQRSVSGHSRNSSLDLRVSSNGCATVSSRSSTDIRNIAGRSAVGHSRAASLDLRHTRNSSADLNKLFRNDVGLVFGAHQGKKIVEICLLCAELF